MVLDRILQITQNKYCSHPLFRAGVQSKYSLHFSVCVYYLIETIVRCRAPAVDLDAESGRRSHIHTDALLGQYSLKKLWNKFGVVGQVIVRSIPPFIA
jgi:hypothetical protein